MSKITNDTPCKENIITQVPLFLYWKVMDAQFSYNDLELAKMTKTSDQDIFTSPKQSLCQNLVLIIFH